MNNSLNPPLSHNKPFISNVRLNRPAAVIATPSGAQPILPTLVYPSAFGAFIYVLVAYGRLAETFLPIPYIAFFFGGLALLFTAISGGLARAAGTRSGKMLLVLTVWLVVCCPFSEWSGGSFKLVLKDHWTKSIAVFFLIAGNVVTFKLYRWLTGTIAASVVIVLIAARLYGVSNNDRFQLEMGTLTNPNDFATHLLVAMPFLLLITDVKGLKSIWGLTALGLTGSVFALVLNTGSRAGLLTLFAFGIYRFIRGSMFTRVALVAIAGVGVVIAPFVISSGSLERYMLMFGYESTVEGSRQTEFAEGSSESRRELLKQSLIVTVTHPIFGVGPGMFQVYLADKTKAQGQRAHWAQTHNSFTQMSSEAGILAGVLYAWLVLRTFRSGRMVWKAAAMFPHQKTLAASGEALVTATVCFIAASSFGNYAYMLYMPLLAGCGEALRSIADVELQSSQVQANRTPAMPPSRFPSSRFQLQK